MKRTGHYWSRRARSPYRYRMALSIPMRIRKNSSFAYSRHDRNAGDPGRLGKIGGRVIQVLVEEGQAVKWPGPLLVQF